MSVYIPRCTYQPCAKCGKSTRRADGICSECYYAPLPAEAKIRPKIRVEMTCAVCGASYSVRPSEQTKILTCSRECSRLLPAKRAAERKQRIMSDGLPDRTPPSARHKVATYEVKICEVCGAAFKLGKQFADKYSTCSDACSRARKKEIHQGPSRTVQCEWCGADVRVAPWEDKTRAKHYCSDECRLAGLNAQPRQRTEGFFGGSVTPRGYRRGFAWRNGTRVAIMEHRWVMEQHLGRQLRPEERIHHINGDKLDNRLENLRLYASHAEHIRTEHPEMAEHLNGWRPQDSGSIEAHEC